jgi:squalene-hopene/tetraprenyl-beta-curcumene cyclase
MKTATLVTALTAAASLIAPALFAAEPPPRDEANVSVRNEIVTAISKGLSWLQRQQQPNGSLANPLNPDPSADNPALTALPLMAFHYEPTGKAGKEYADVLKKGYGYLRAQVQPDGGIYSKGLSNYNTSVCLEALLQSGDPKDEPILTNARAFIVGQQAKGMIKPETDGGLGYGPTAVNPKRGHPDLDNTLIALEALYAYKKARPTVEIPKDQDLNWQAAIDFVSRCQNLKSTNKLAWASDDPANKGGFIYYPGDSNAGEQKLPDGKTALRSYGSMTYAGLLSFIYADLKKDDPRVSAALEWLGKNYTLDENPGMGRAGLYYYYHLAAKGLATAKIAEIETPDGKKVKWPREMALKLMDLQKPDGSWMNDTPRWMETDPVLVTTYGVLTLEILYNQL